MQLRSSPPLRSHQRPSTIHRVPLKCLSLTLPHGQSVWSPTMGALAKKSKRVRKKSFLRLLFSLLEGQHEDVHQSAYACCIEVGQMSK